MTQELISVKDPLLKYLKNADIFMIKLAAKELCANFQYKNNKIFSKNDLFRQLLYNGHFHLVPTKDIATHISLEDEKLMKAASRLDKQSIAYKAFVNICDIILSSTKDDTLQDLLYYFRISNCSLLFIELLEKHKSIDGNELSDFFQKNGIVSFHTRNFVSAYCTKFGDSMAKSFYGINMYLWGKSETDFNLIKLDREKEAVHCFGHLLALHVELGNVKYVSSYISQMETLDYVTQNDLLENVVDFISADDLASLLQVMKHNLNLNLLSEQVRKRPDLFAELLELNQYATTSNVISTLITSRKCTQETLNNAIVAFEGVNNNKKPLIVIGSIPSMTKIYHWNQNIIDFHANNCRWFEKLVLRQKNVYFFCEVYNCTVKCDLIPYFIEFVSDSPLNIQQNELLKLIRMEFLGNFKNIRSTIASCHYKAIALCVYHYPELIPPEIVSKWWFLHPNAIKLGNELLKVFKGKFQLEKPIFSMLQKRKKQLKLQLYYHCLQLNHVFTNFELESIGISPFDKGFQ